MIIHLIVGLIKKILLYENELFSTLQFSKNSYRKNKLEFELDFFNYVTKSDLKMQQMLIHLNFLIKQFS